MGVYEFAPTVTLTVTREGGQLYAMLTGQPKFEIFPEGEKNFFLKVVDAQLTFDADSVVLHQNGRDQKAKKR